MPTLLKIAGFFRRHWWFFAYLLLLFFSFAYFTVFQLSPTFPDPDSFYHAKMAVLMSESGVIKNFPWLQATILKDVYIDQHFLYHLLLVPFVKIMDPLVGAKLANIILSVGLIVFFYWLLRRYQIKFAFLFTLLLLFSKPFIFRINLIKAPVLSVLLLLIGLHLIFQYRQAALFIFSFIYVWAYGGFILILVFSGLYALAGLLKDWRDSRRRFFKRKIWRHNHELKLFFASLAGLGAGLVINPYFPQNIIFYWHQLVKIGIINYQKVIAVGGEWYPNKFVDLTAETALLTVIILLALVPMAFNFRRLKKKEIFLFFVFAFFFAFTMKSKRYVEYYVPFAFIFAAFALNEKARSLSWRKLWVKLTRFFDRQKILAVVLTVYFLVAIPTVVLKGVVQNYRDFQGGSSFHRFERSSAWLKKNSQAGEIVFHSSWDEFPPLFYHNSHNYYIAGLDPTFTYEYDQDLYWQMVNITTGKQKENIHQSIKNNFRAAYVLVSSRHKEMNSNIIINEGFKQVYQDEEAYIYQVL